MYQWYVVDPNNLPPIGTELIIFRTSTQSVFKATLTGKSEEYLGEGEFLKTVKTTKGTLRHGDDLWTLVPQMQTKKQEV